VHRFPGRQLALLSLLTLMTLVACNGKVSRPLLPVAEYEKLIVGRIDADYVGTDNCVAQCHRHDKLTDDFRHSVHGEQIKAETGLPLVNCESCHGPGSLAIANLEAAKNATRRPGQLRKGHPARSEKSAGPGPVVDLPALPQQRLNPQPVALAHQCTRHA